MYTYGNSLIRKDSEYPLFDGGGHERTVTNGSQTVTGTINFDGFGNTVGSTGSSANPYMYGAASGYRTEGDAGLSHVGARYYDAQVGRFITRDTYLDQKPYLYCEHDPINATDRSGHFPSFKEIAAVVIMGAGGVMLGEAIVVGGSLVLPIIVVVGGIGLLIWAIKSDIDEGAKAAGDAGVGGGNNDGSNLGNGGRGKGPGNDFNGMSDKWEHETGQ